MTKERIFCFFWHLASVSLMLTIFGFSSQNGSASSDTSSGIVGIFFSDFSDEYVEFMSAGGFSPFSSTEYFIRKCSHFCEYALLGFCCVNAVFYHSKDIETVMSAGLLFCFAYACSDEIHQCFVAGRSSEFGDVMIDFSGAITGIFLAIAVQKCMHALKNTN